MRYIRFSLNPGMTAIAAVVALSSTPLTAQVIDALPPATNAPVIIAPPPASPASPPVAVSVPATEPVVRTPPSLPPPDLSRITEVPPKFTPPAARTDRTPPVATRPQAKRAIQRETAPAAAGVQASTTPVAARPVVLEQPPVSSLPVEPKSAVVDEPADENVLAVAGIAALGALMTAFAALILGFRRRGADEDEDEEDPVIVVPAAKAESVAASPRAAVVPSAVDMSRYGPHVRAAYRGPTRDNPSLSLKRRLKRASFFDQRDRLLGAEAPPRPESLWTNSQNAKVRFNTDQLMSRPSTKPSPSFYPVFQN